MDLKSELIDMTRSSMVTILNNKEINNDTLEKLRLVSQRVSEFKTMSDIVSSYKERWAPCHLM